MESSTIPVISRYQDMVVQFLTAGNVSASENYRRMQNVYGMKCMKRRSVFRWLRDFRSARSSTDDTPRPDQAHVVKQVADMDRLVKMNRRITTREIAKKMSMSIRSMHTVLRKRLRYHKVCAQWVPKHLTEEQEIHHISASMKFLMRWYLLTFLCDPIVHNSCDPPGRFVIRCR
ncbi:uncharacterized protein LOC118180767, partial [Stegodyphus dumicola]|uniref:uncharacterized protein LOC118180767 n=1 Tax=Stegodyphus dumicola TaxID=202533 RepID=UPI0015B065E4